MIALGKIKDVLENLEPLKEIFVEPKIVKKRKIAKMLDTLFLEKILLKNVKGEYVNTTKQESMPRKIHFSMHSRFHFVLFLKQFYFKFVDAEDGTALLGCASAS